MSQPVDQKKNNGVTDNFAGLVNTYQDLVYNTAISIVQNEEDAEDITQEVFLKAYESIKEFREESAISTWLYRITINKSLDHEKYKKRQKRGGGLAGLFGWKESDEPPEFYHPGIASENKEKGAILMKEINRLPESQRIIFILIKLEGRSYAEAADITNSSITAAESLMQRANKKLRERLQNYYEQNLK